MSPPDCTLRECETPDTGYPSSRHRRWNQRRRRWVYEFPRLKAYAQLHWFDDRDRKKALFPNPTLHLQEHIKTKPQRKPKRQKRRGRLSPRYIDKLKRDCERTSCGSSSRRWLRSGIRFQTWLALRGAGPADEEQEARAKNKLVQPASHSRLNHDPVWQENDERVPRRTNEQTTKLRVGIQGIWYRVGLL